MQRSYTMLMPLSRHLGGHSVQIQPSRNFFIRGSRLPVFWNPAVIHFEEHMRDMSRHFDRVDRELNSAWGLRSLLPTSFLRPTTPMSMYESELEGKYQMNVVIGDRFAPENIKVTLKDHVLTVEAKYDQVSEDGKSRVHQEYTRQFSLPEKIDLTEVKSLFTAEGILQIEAPLPQAASEAAKTAKEIPIVMESSK